MSDRVVSVLILSDVVLAGVALAFFYLYRHLRRLNVIRPRGLDSQDDRNESISITALWTNVVALSLISIVGVAQIGVELWRLNSDEKPYASTVALEELLRAKLIDAEDQKPAVQGNCRCDTGSAAPRSDRHT